MTTLSTIQPPPTWREEVDISDSVNVWQRMGLSPEEGLARLGINAKRASWDRVAGEMLAAWRDIRATLKAIEDGTWSEAA